MERSHYLTKPERMFRDEASKQGLVLEQQYPLKYSFILDFAIPEKKICIEIDGNKWHNYPYGTSRDRMKDAILKKKGWIIYRYWESDIYENIENIIKELKSKM